MSLINQMLRDLDARERPGERETQVETVSTPGRQPVRGWVILLSAGVLFIAALFYFEPQIRQLIERSTGSSQPADPDMSVPSAAAVVKTPIETRIEPMPSKLLKPAERPTPVETVEAIVNAHSLSATPEAQAQRPSVQQISQGVDEPVALPGLILSTRLEKTDLTAGNIGDEIKKPGVTGIYSSMVEPTQEKPEIKRPVTLSALKQARYFIENGRMAEAEERLRLSLKQNYKRHEARHLLSTILMRSGRDREAMLLVEEGLTLQSDYIPFLRARGRLLWQQRSLSEAENMLKQVLQQDADDIETLQMLGAIYQTEKQFGQALPLYKRLVQITPESSHAWAGLAISLDMTGEYVQAVASYRTALGFYDLPNALAKYARRRVQALEEKR
ncbi:MAG: tetratricopeptide repeat protein [Gammaproteobacteria bacterium]|nr:tetratricopeptide repeat protein [Gammaproteobacteria bacterium]